MDGPVVRAAQEALDREAVEAILPYVHKLYGALHASAHGDDRPDHV